MAENVRTGSTRRCPQCGSRVKRVLRTANDKRRWDADDWRRYRCRSDTCAWQGLLASTHRHRTRVSPLGDAPALIRVGKTALLLLFAAGVAWGGLVALQAMMGH